MNNEIENKVEQQSEKSTVASTISAQYLLKEGLNSNVFGNKLDTSRDENITAMIGNFSIHNSDLDSQGKSDAALPQQPFLEAKLPWEHPTSPTDAANHAFQEIKNSNLGPYGGEAAGADWLNDTWNKGKLSDSEFRTKAANAYNELYGKRTWAPVMDPEASFKIKAIKQNGEIQFKNE